MRAVEDRGGHLPAERPCGAAQVDLQHLPDVHTGRNAQRVEHDIQRRAVGQEGHILLRQDAGHDALVAVAAGHLIAHRDLALLGDIAAHHHVDARGQLVAVFAGEHLDVHDGAVLAVRHAQGGVAHLARLFAEDGAQQALLGGELGLALGRHLAHQDIPGAHLRTHADDAAFVQLAQRVVRNVGDVAGDLFGSELGVAGLHLVLLHVDGGEHVVADAFFVDENRVLVVVALPGHEPDQSIFAQRDLAIAGGGAICDDLPLHDMLVVLDDRALVDAGALVGAHKFNQLIGFQRTVAVRLDDDLVGRDLLDRTVLLGEHGNAGIDRRLVLHAGAHDGGIGLEQGHRLALHVGAHQRAVRVVVLQKGDHRGRDRDDHLGGDIHVIDLFALDLEDLIAEAAGDAGTHKAALLVQRFVRLRHAEVILHVGGHVDDLLGDHAGVFVHAAVGRLDETVLVDAGEGREVGDQADVGTLRGFNRAHAAVMAVVHVANLESRAVTGQTAGTQGRQAALVGQLRERVGLIHELRQRRGAEKLLDRRDHRADVDQRLRGDHIHILRLDGHALAHHALHTGKTDAELILQQLAHRTDAAVAQMVDVVGVAHAIGQVVDVVDGGENIVLDDVLGDQLIEVRLDGFLEGRLILVLLEQLAQDTEADLLVDAQLRAIKRHIIFDIHHAVGQNKNVHTIHSDCCTGHARRLDLHGLVIGEHLARFGEQLAGHGVDDRLGDHMARQALADAQLFVVFVAAYAGEVVAARVEEQVLQVGDRAVHRRRLARAQLAVDLEQRFFAVLGVILVLNRLDQALVLAKDVEDLLVGAVAVGEPVLAAVLLVVVQLEQRAEEHRHRNFAVFIDADIKDIVGVGFIFQPRTAVGDHGGGEQLLTGLVVAHAVIDARRTDELGDDDALRTVDDKSAAIGHQGKVSHEDILFLDLAGLLVEQAGAHTQGSRIGHIPGFALLNRVLGRVVEMIVNKVEYKVTGVIGD